jgi:hypothetical protein
MRLHGKTKACGYSISNWLPVRNIHIDSEPASTCFFRFFKTHYIPSVLPPDRGVLWIAAEHHPRCLSHWAVICDTVARACSIQGCHPQHG